MDPEEIGVHRTQAQRFAIARAIRRTKRAKGNDVMPSLRTMAPRRSATPAPTPMDEEAPRPVVASAPKSIHLDLQAATLREGRAANGSAYAVFTERGQGVVMGFGHIAHVMKEGRMARGMAVEQAGLTKIVAIDTGAGLLDDRGQPWRRAA